METRDVVLAIDVGTSSVKVGLIDGAGNIIDKTRKTYSYSMPSKDHVELNLETVWMCVLEAVKTIKKNTRYVQAIGLSVFCPGLVPLNKKGNQLHPAIIHLDRRSIREGKWALKTIGEKRFLSSAGNLPYPGGVSLTSILWIKKHEPEIYRQTCFFGHTNTFLVRRLTGKWGIDPTNASFTGLYNTMDASDWDKEIVKGLDIEPDKLPRIFPSYAVVGKLKPGVARCLGIPSGTPVVMGAGDTSSAAFGAGVVEEGDILNSTGTVEVMVLSTSTPKSSPNFLIRTHVTSGKWLIMNIIPTGGEAIEWVRRQFYNDVHHNKFYEEKLHRVISEPHGDIEFKPYLSGDRTSFIQKKGSFTGLTLRTTRDDLLKAVCYGIMREMKKRFHFYKTLWQPSGKICYTGGGMKAMLELKKKFYPEFIWKEVPEAALLGASKLAWMGLSKGIFSAQMKERKCR